MIAVRLMIGLAVVVVVLGWQIRAVLRSPHPTLRGVEGVAVSVPLLVLTFAGAYVSDHNVPSSFPRAWTGSMGRTSR